MEVTRVMWLRTRRRVTRFVSAYEYEGFARLRFMSVECSSVTNGPFHPCGTPL